MTDDDFDDLETLPDDEDDGYVRIKKDDLKSVRKAARSAGAAREKLATYERRDKVREAGLEGLTERQIATLAREVGDDDSPEKLRELAVEFKWAEPAEPSQEQQQTEAEIAGQSEAAAISTGAEPPAQRTQVKPEDINSWPADKLLRLNEDHPELAELVLQGQSINLPPGFN